MHSKQKESNETKVEKIRFYLRQKGLNELSLDEAKKIQEKKNRLKTIEKTLLQQEECLRLFNKTLEHGKNKNQCFTCKHNLSKNEFSFLQMELEKKIKGILQTKSELEFEIKKLKEDVGFKRQFKKEIQELNAVAENMSEVVEGIRSCSVKQAEVKQALSQTENLILLKEKCL